MESIISNKSLKGNPTARRLLDHFENSKARLGLVDASVYYEYPLYQDYEDDVYKPSLLIISNRAGVVVIKTSTSVDHLDLESADEQLSQVNSLILSKLVKSKLLRNRSNTLKIPIIPILFVDSDRSTQVALVETENQVISSLGALDELLAPVSNQEIEAAIIAETKSIIDGTKALRRGPSRNVPDGESDTKRAILAELESEIVNFDETQRNAAISFIGGAQRIRGLAGSGKTVILAMKAAQLHLDNPDAQLLVTFNTKSLYETIRTLITRFFRQTADRDPDWDKVHVRHGWGGATLEGVYSGASKSVGLKPMTFGQVPRTYADKFDYVCKTLLQTESLIPQYDHILIDEAQDFGNSFFRLCLALCKGSGDERSIVWAYDELQSIFNTRTRTPLELFGTRDDGLAEIDLERSRETLQLPSYLNNDIVLHKCYRNAREVLVCAHALGFGIYASAPVQMLEDRSHWEDVGYEVLSGDFRVGSKTDLFRPFKNSPLSISNRQSISDLISFCVADSFGEELQWIVDGIEGFLKEGLMPEDILVVSLDDQNTKAYFEGISTRLHEKEIQVNNLRVVSSNNQLFRVDGETTLSTVYQAKGNEAAVVFVVGLDGIFPQRHLRLGRNKIFTAMTRSKAWVRLSGMQNSSLFIEELKQAMENCPHLRFEYPDPAKVNTIQRDLSDQSAKLVKIMHDLDETGVTREEFINLLNQLKKA